MMPQRPPTAPRLEPPLFEVPAPTSADRVEPSTIGSSQEEEAQLVDLGPLWDVLRVVLGALQRRPRPAAAGFVLGAAAVAGLVAMFPRTYHTETRILAQRNLVMPALGNPRRAVPIDSDTPTRAVSETILTRENLLALISDLKLQERWQAEQAPIQRLKELVVDAIRPRTEAERLDALVGILEQRLHVTTDESSVTIGIDWQNPHTAYDVVRLAQDNFLEARHATEVSTIDETISILDRHASDARATMEQAIDQIAKARADVPGPSVPGQAPPRVRGHPQRVIQAQAEVTDLRNRLERKRQQISEMEQARQREVGQLTAQLAQQRAVYAPAHPALVATEQSLKNLSLPPPGLAALRAEEVELAEQLQKATDEERAARGFSPRPEVEPGERAGARGDRSDEEDSRVEYPKTQLKIAADSYEDLLRRIDAARIELDTAQAAFKYRYRVIRPAEIPERATKPKALVVVVGALLSGILLAIATALLLDRRGNLIHSAWQVEKQLEVPVLGELSGP